MMQEITAAMARLDADGFIRCNHQIATHRMHDEELRSKSFIFRSTLSGVGHDRKYGTYHLFGGILYYLVMDSIPAKIKFVIFLRNLFNERNPKPDLALKKTFTRLLHDSNLHCQACPCVNRWAPIQSQEEMLTAV